MKLNHMLKRSINRYAHAEGIRHEILLKTELTARALKCLEEGKIPEEIGFLLGIVAEMDVD